MKHPGGLLVILGGVGLVGLAGTDLAACGDKFLVVGRGTRFQRAGERNQSVSVLIYAPPSSSLGDRPRVLSVEKALARAGYHSATAATSNDLSGLLRSGSPAVVLTDIADAQAVGRRLGAGSSDWIVLPFLSDATHRAVVEARKTWGGAVKISASPESVLDAVDEAVDRLVRSRKNSGPKS